MISLENIEPGGQRTLPVILILDCSGSMAADGKIEALNDSVIEMINELRVIDDSNGYITLSVVVFGGPTSRVTAKNIPVRDFAFDRLVASGLTPMGDAFNQVELLINDRSALPSSGYQPTLALVSDGFPQPALENELENLLSSERGMKSARFALAIGSDADRTLLQKFASDGHVHEAGEASEIRHFLRWVTNTIVEKTRAIPTEDGVAPLSDRTREQFARGDSF